jgi:CheY-specific phosphatase CheX/anti-anti-sigma regulatory factor
MAKMVMKPAIENEIAVYRLDDDLSESVANNFVEIIQQHRSILRSLRVKAVLFSFKHIASVDSAALLRIVEWLDLLQRQLRVSTGFCEYSPKQYTALRHLTRKRAVFLYKNFKIAELGVGVSRIRKNALVLVYDEDRENKTDMVSDLISKGYAAISAMNRKDYEKRLSGKTRYEERVVNSAFGGMTKTVGVGYHQHLFVYTFRGAVDENSNGTFKRQAHLERIKWGYKLFVFDLSGVQILNARGAYYLYELAKESRNAGAAIALIGLSADRFEPAALRVLEKSSFYVCDSLEDVFGELRLESALRANHRVFDAQSELTRELIVQLPIFMAAAQEALPALTGLSFKRGATVRTTIEEAGLRGGGAGALMSLAGDVFGSIFIYMPDETMAKVSEALTADAAFSQAEGEDIAREIANTVLGKAKNFLAERGVCIGLSLPVRMNEYKDVAEGFESVTGVRMSLVLEEQPIYLLFIGSVELEIP